MFIHAHTCICMYFEKLGDNICVTLSWWDGLNEDREIKRQGKVDMFDYIKI